MALFFNRLKQKHKRCGKKREKGKEKEGSCEMGANHGLASK